jgi:hypothetical protein
MAKKSMAKYKGQSKEGQFVEVQSIVGQKIKYPLKKTKTEATSPHVVFIIIFPNWCFILNKTGNLPCFNLLLF